MDEQPRQPDQPVPAAHTTDTLLQRFYDSVPFMMGVAELRDGKVVVVSGNQPLGQFVGREPEDLIGGSIAELSGSAELEHLRIEHYLRAQHTGLPVRAEFPNPRPGRSQWLAATVTYIGLGAAGNPQFSFIIEDITARKHADEQLRASEERFRIMFHSSPAPQAITNYETGRFFDANSAYCHMVGYSRAELIGKTAHELHLTLSSTHRDQVLLQLERDDFASWVSTEMRTRSGELHSILGSVKLLEWQGQRCLITSALDVTEQKRAEALLEQRVAERTAALRESKQRFAIFFAKSPIPMGVLRLSDDRYVNANSALLELFGYSREDIIGHTPHEIGVWPDAAVRQRFLKQLQADGFVSNFETQNRHRSGRIIDTLISSQIVEISNIQYLLSQIIDVSKQKHADRLLREREHFITSVLKTAPAIMYVYDLETQSNVFANGGLTRLLGYTAKQIQAMGDTIFPQIIHPDDLAGVQAFQHTVMAAADFDVLESESRAKHHDGSWRVLRNYESPFLRNPDGTLKQKIGIAIDVTEQKQMQRELEKSHEQLRSLSRQLIETRENESRAIGRELHDEIGQNLTGLKLLLEIALTLPPEEARAKQTAALAVVNDLLARTSRLSLDLRPPMLDDMGVVPALLWLTQNISAQTNVQINFAHSGVHNQRFAPAIETAIYRLAQEALTNISRHAAVQQASIRLSATPTGLDLQIEDMGAGFDFEAVRARRTSGLLGMIERVNLLNGKLTIHTAPGNGTSIFISIPRAEKA